MLERGGGLIQQHKALNNIGHCELEGEAILVNEDGGWRIVKYSQSFIKKSIVLRSVSRLSHLIDEP